MSKTTDKLKGLLFLYIDMRDSSESKEAKAFLDVVLRDLVRIINEDSNETVTLTSHGYFIYPKKKAR